MKIIYYCDWYKEYTAYLAMGVVSKSIDVTVIARDLSPEFAGRRADEKLVHHGLLANGVELCLLPGKYSSIKSMLTLNRIYRAKRQAGYDRFHLQQTGDPRFLWLALRMPTVLTIHEPTARLGVVRGANRLRSLTSGIVQRFYRRFADLIVVHTTSNFNGLTSSERRKAVIIPHGVAPAPVRSAAESKTILFFGRAAGYKGIDILLAAMGRVWAAEPRARLRIMASPGDYAAVQVRDPRIDATWDGYSSEQLERELADARVVCMPYTSVSGSGVGAQAYGSGKPIVATALEGLRELVHHEELLARPDDENDLARALIAALGTDYGQQDIDPQRTWSEVAATHIRAYQPLVRVHDER